jgi:hypothetical protein
MEGLKFKPFDTVKRKGCGDVFTISKCNSAVKKYQLMHGNVEIPDWVPEDELELVQQVASEGVQNDTTIVPDPLFLV